MTKREVGLWLLGLKLARRLPHRICVAYRVRMIRRLRQGALDLGYVGATARIDHELYQEAPELYAKVFKRVSLP